MFKTAPVRIHALKPRNPHALAARQKHAGAHRRGTGALRQAAKRHLKVELTESTHPPPAR